MFWLLCCWLFTLCLLVSSSEYLQITNGLTQSQDRQTVGPNIGHCLDPNHLTVSDGIPKELNEKADSKDDIKAWESAYFLLHTG